MRKKTCVGLLMAAAAILVWPGCASGETDGSIRIESVAVGKDSIKIVALAKNTGSTKHEFPVGCSLKRRDGTWYDISYQLHELEKGEEGKVLFQVQGVNVRHFVLVRVAIWDREGADGGLDGRFDMDERPIRSSS